MNILDPRTIMICYLMANALSAMVLTSLWRQNRRLPGLNFWLADFIMQFAGIALIVLRGNVPNFLSMVVSNTLIIGGTLLLFIGLEKYTDRLSAQWHNYFSLAFFFAIQTYFTLAQDSLQYRNVNISFFMMLFSLQAAWLLLRRADGRMRKGALSTGLILSGLGVLSLIRIFIDLSIHPGNDFFKSGFYDSIILLIYQMLNLSLTFALFLMVNRRLLTELENDVTEIKLTEAALKSSEEKFFKAFQTSPYAISITRVEDGKFIDVNEAFTSIAGITREEALSGTTLGMKIWVNEEDRSSVVAILRAGGAVNGKELLFRKKNGEIIIGLFSAQMIQLSQGLCIFSSINDITERKQADKALRASEESYRFLMDNVPDIIYSLDGAGNIVTVNSPAFERYGYTEQDSKGKPFFNFIHPDDREIVIGSFLNALEDQRKFTHGLQFRIVAENGLSYWFELNSQAHFDSQGGYTGEEGVLRDITERKQAEEALRESENIMRAWLNAIQESAFLVDREGIIIAANSTVAERLHHTVEELVGACIYDFVPAETARTRRSYLDQVVETGQLVRFEDERFGRIIYNLVYPVFDQAGQVKYLAILGTDITERKQAEQALLQANERLALALRSAGAGLWDWDMTTGKLDWSPEFFHLIGLDPATTQATFDVWRSILHPDDRQMAEDFISESVRNHTPLLNEYRIVMPSGEIRWISAWGDTVYNELGEALRMSGICIDITERKQVEQALRDSEDKFKYFFEYSNIGKSITQPSGGEIHVNQAFCKMLGFSMEELQNKKWQEITHPDDVALTRTEMAVLLSGEKDSARFTRRLLKKDGSILWADISSYLRRDEQFKPLYFMTALVDITARKQAEDKILQLNAELEQRVEERTRELRDAQEQLVRHEKLSVLGQMASSVGHELRNPLAVITSALYYLKLVQPDADEKIKKYLDMIQQEVHTSEKIITDLLDFARIKSVDREAVSVSELIRQTLERFPAPESVDVSIDIPTDLPKVFVDLRQMTQVLGNLTVNACQAMKDGGKLTVISRQSSVKAGSLITDNWILITVKDTGVGISAENMKKLFEPLFTTKAKGIGLGLVVSKKLIEANGGRIEVESEAGAGSTFTVWLPVK